MHSSHELSRMAEIGKRLARLRTFLHARDFPAPGDTTAWYSYLSDVKVIQGNFNIDVSFLATLLVKEYLGKKYGLREFDATAKAQGAPGIDIDVQLPDGRHLIAEIKTTTPYGANDLGAQQKATFKKDFFKLANHNANIKYFFLTDSKTYELMKRTGYRSQLTGVIVFLLPAGPEFRA